MASGSNQAMLPGGCSTVAIPPLQATASKRSLPRLCMALLSSSHLRAQACAGPAGLLGVAEGSCTPYMGGRRGLSLQCPTNKFAGEACKDVQKESCAWGQSSQGFSCLLGF